jgi:hypothetical protein
LAKLRLRICQCIEKPWSFFEAIDLLYAPIFFSIYVFRNFCKVGLLSNS